MRLYPCVVRVCVDFYYFSLRITPYFIFALCRTNEGDVVPALHLQDVVLLDYLRK